MYKMVIADDEAHVREGLRTIVPWHDLHIEIVGEASDGEEALELCGQLKPDILLTDIRMPFMDGLEVAARLREREEHTYIVIISGFQDFRYAQTALSMSVDAYILKPIKMEELMETIHKITRRIERELNTSITVESLQKQLIDHMPVIRDKFLANWLTGYYKSERTIREKLAYVQLLQDEDRPLYAASLRIDDYDQAIAMYTEEHIQLIRFALLNVAEEIVSQSALGAVCSIGENEFGFVLWGRPEEHHALSREVIAALKRFLKLSVSIGIGSKSTILDVDLSYHQAVEALQHTYYTGSNSIVLYEDIQQPNGMGVELANVLKLHHRVISNIKSGLAEETKLTVEEIFDHVRRYQGTTPEYVQSLCIDLLYACQRTLMEFGDDFAIINEHLPNLIQTIHKQVTLDSLKSYMIHVLVKLAESFAGKNNQKHYRVIQTIKDYIQKNYMNEITIHTLSEILSLSPNYISLIFKKGTGETITDYTVTVKMENAKQLLKSMDLKILDIAEMVGYENTNYFSTVFKKYTGMHPGKYRQMVKEQDNV
ncbi:hypothetical protein SY83_21890 [Paenibacillus swuensis]|uniref:AraC family transcriptional regulator n=1 Tax=Paenibacillus swuensis TaxID=1178515 RepID=A0A172TNM4_9BACL|nr:response regulator [Paenibacillus swuensis]ANE48494.1 hypothetical protein SY83_21890 [Paenibacillus swuensis]